MGMKQAASFQAELARGASLVERVGRIQTMLSCREGERISHEYKTEVIDNKVDAEKDENAPQERRDGATGGE
jgi:hypothetical protein